MNFHRSLLTAVYGIVLLSPGYGLAADVDSSFFSYGSSDKLIEEQKQETRAERRRRMLKEVRSALEAQVFPAPVVLMRDLSSPMEGDDVMRLRTGLMHLGYLSPLTDRPRHFDAGLKNTVMRFQTDYGLVSDGVVGAQTRDVLMDPRRSLLVKIDQALGVPDPVSGPEQIVVNIPSMRVVYLRDDVPVFMSRAIIGRLGRETPSLSVPLSAFSFNPSWHVPPGIKAKDVIPAMRKDPSHAEKNNFIVYGKEDGKWVPVDPTTVDWSVDNPPYLFVQKAGPTTALGRIKFEMPNSQHIYLHDTPDRSLFDRTRRAVSSGCVRVEGIEDFTRMLIGESAWESANISGRLEEGKTFRHRLDREIPVTLEYRLADLSSDGRIEFYPDLYGYLPASQGDRVEPGEDDAPLTP